MLRSNGVQNEDAGLLTRMIFWFTRRRLGRVPQGMRIRALVPKFLRHAVRMDIFAASKGLVPMSLKELAQLKVAMLVGCPF